jgi:hypothetical protein
MPGTIFVRDAGFVERGHFFGGAAEDERIAALEADHTAAGAGVLDHQRVDFVLGDGLCAAALADVDDFGARRGELENGLRDEIVVEDHVGGLDEAQRLDGEQVGIAGAGADEINFAGGNTAGLPCRVSRKLARGAGQWRQAEADRRSGRWAS